MTGLGPVTEAECKDISKYVKLCDFIDGLAIYMPLVVAILLYMAASGRFRKVRPHTAPDPGAS